MKIPLDVRKHSEGLKPFATIHLKIPNQKTICGTTIRGIIWPFVDTGSPLTIISETDSEKLGIEVSGTPEEIWLGGAQLDSYNLKRVVLKVVCEDKKTICDISIPEVGVIRPILSNENSILVSKSIPSIIGVNLLEYHRLALYFDAYNQISYLEKVQKKKK